MVVGAQVEAREIGDLGALYADHAERVRRLVRSDVRAPAPVIDDACQTAWSRLVRHRADVGADRAVPWLVTTAVREVFRDTRRANRDVSLEELLDEVGELQLPRVMPAADEVVARRARLDSVAEVLPDRQRRLVWLQALGWSYLEMAQQTGDTPRTVERQLLRARRALRECESSDDD